MIKVLSFLSNEKYFAGHSRGPCGPRFEHHWSKVVYSAMHNALSLSLDYALILCLGASPVMKIFLQLVSMTFPLLVLLSHCWLSIEFFIPLCGRLGSVVPPDFVIAVLTSVCTSICGMFAVSLIHVVRSLRW